MNRPAIKSTFQNFDVLNLNLDNTYAAGREITISKSNASAVTITELSM